MLAPCAKAFQSKDKASNTFTILKDLASVGPRRHGRVQHVGDAKQTETMLVLSRNQINLPPVKYQVYQGDTDGCAIGPVVLAPPKLQWQATRADKKLISGPGRKPAAEAPRTDDLVEPVFFHSMPVAFYQELLDAFSLSGVIDLSPGEGTRALACMRKMLPYVGITLTEQHSARLMARLDARVSAWE